jgi:hypothetical protein
MNDNLNKLKNDILQDGVIDPDEVLKLKNVLYADGVIDKEEAELLFELNDATADKNNCSEWADFFCEAISDYVLADEESPGIVDESEAEYLIKKIEGDDQIDDIEKQLLQTIKRKAKNIHETLAKFIDSSC